jgi:hypothetical protein
VGLLEWANLSLNQLPKGSCLLFKMQVLDYVECKRTDASYQEHTEMNYFQAFSWGRKGMPCMEMISIHYVVCD